MDVDPVNDDSLDDSESNPRKKPKPQPKGNNSKPRHQKPPTSKKEAKVSDNKGKPPQGQTQIPDPQPPKSGPPQAPSSAPNPPPAQTPTTSSSCGETRTETRLLAPQVPAPGFTSGDMCRPPPPPPYTQYRPYMMPQTFNFNPGYGIPANLMPSYQASGAQGWNNWNGPPAQQVQLPPPQQQPSRRSRLNDIRSGIAALQGQIIAAQNDPKGDTDISHLVQQEAALKQRLYEHYED